jgi:hypothetical protein
MIAVLASNIVVDFLTGIDQARTELAQYSTAYISPITWIKAQVKDFPATMLGIYVPYGL